MRLKCSQIHIESKMDDRNEMAEESREQSSLRDRIAALEARLARVTEAAKALDHSCAHHPHLQCGACVMEAALASTPQTQRPLEPDCTCGHPRLRHRGYEDHDECDDCFGRDEPCCHYEPAAHAGEGRGTK